MPKDTKNCDLEPVVSELLRTFPEQTETVFEMVEALDGCEGQRLQISHQTMQPEPPKEPELARSDKRAFTFHNVAGFCSHVQRQGSEEKSIVLIDATETMAVFVYDQKREFGGHEIARFQPCFSSQVKKWTGGPWPAAEFAKFVLENRSSIVRATVGDGDDKATFTAKETAMYFRQVRTSRNVTVESGSGAKSINGVMVEVKIGSSAAGEVQQLAIELPDTIVVNLPIFVGSQDDTFLDFDLFVYEENGQVFVSATCAELEAAILKEFNESVEFMEKELDEFEISLGEFGTSPCEVVCN